MYYEINSYQDQVRHLFTYASVIIWHDTNVSHRNTRNINVDINTNCSAHSFLSHQGAGPESSPSTPTSRSSAFVELVEELVLICSDANNSCESQLWDKQQVDNMKHVTHMIFFSISAPPHCLACATCVGEQQTFFSQVFPAKLWQGMLTENHKSATYSSVARLVCRNMQKEYAIIWNLCWGWTQSIEMSTRVRCFMFFLYVLLISYLKPWSWHVALHLT